MATPLVWETCRMSNVVYTKLLGYQAPLQFDPDTKSFRATKQISKTFNLSLLVISTVIFALCYVVFDICFLNYINKIPHVLVVNLAGLFLGLGIVLALLPMLKNREVWWAQYLNNVMSLEIKVTKPWDYTRSKDSGFTKIWIAGILQSKFNFKF